MIFRPTMPIAKPGLRSACLAGVCLATLSVGRVHAQPAPASAPQGSQALPSGTNGTPPASAPGSSPAAGAPADPNAPPATWASSIKLTAQFDGGVTFNADRPRDGLNWGRAFDDRANQVLLNQALFTAQRALDPKATGYDFGFKFQGMYGTDARYVQSLGEFNNLTNSRYQLAIVEANVAVHLPWLFEGGIDLKAGQYATPLGFETIDPSTNPFYSHSYIFNFGLPFTHTGVLTVSHVSPVVDIYAGIDSGENTTLGGGDNNRSPAGIFGANLTLLGGDLTILALTHLGPENSYRAGPGAEKGNRFENDGVITYKVNPKLTLTAELNYIRDDYFKADGYGIAGYAAYALTDTLSLNGRAEVFRDEKGFFVTGITRGRDFVQAEYGYPTAIGRGPATYSEFTLGVTYKPTLPAPISSFLVRPEVRYDQTLNRARPYAAGRNNGSFTFASDIIIGF